jgi:hypothetical protein
MKKNKGHTDKELAEFESALLRSIDQTSRGEAFQNLNKFWRAVLDDPKAL